MSELKEYGAGSFPLISRQVFSWAEVVDFLKEKNQPIPVHPIEYIVQQITEYYPEYKDLPMLKQASYLDLHYYIASYHTLRSDLPSMLSSVELRFPFLDHLFVQKYFNQTDTFRDIDRKLKPRFRDYVKDVLPASILSQPKKGFGLATELGDELAAQKSWYTDSLRLLFQI